jgi:phage terminase large subunit
VKIIKEIPIWVKSKWRAIDWGFSLDPTAIETVGFYKNSIYVDEECYSTGMLNPDIIKKLKQLPRLKIWADNAEPKTIKEISNAGFYIQGAKKGAGSILDGIQFMQGYTIYITERSFNIKKEFDNYTWQQDRNGKWIQMPVDDYNHAIDGIRYVCSMELMGKVDKERKQLGRTASAFAH